MKLPKIKIPKIDLYNWPSSSFNLFTISGVGIGIGMLGGSYNHYLKGDMINTGFGIAMSLMIICIYVFNNRMIHSFAKSRFELWKEIHFWEEELNISKMRAEIILRRGGHEVPEVFLADIPDLEDFFQECGDPECGDHSNLREFQKQLNLVKDIPPKK